MAGTLPTFVDRTNEQIIPFSTSRLDPSPVLRHFLKSLSLTHNSLQMKLDPSPFTLVSLKVSVCLSPSLPTSSHNSCQIRLDPSALFHTLHYLKVSLSFCLPVCLCVCLSPALGGCGHRTSVMANMKAQFSFGTNTCRPSNVNVPKHGSVQSVTPKHLC